MADVNDKNPSPEDKLGGSVRDLKQALARARNRQAERGDVVVDLKVAEAGRLELLADELRPVFNDIDETDERFEFALSKGERPRLWIDMTSFLVMGTDKRSYRFLKDTRMGRVVLAETSEIGKMADIVSDYVAEKVLEREQFIEGEWVSQRQSAERNGADDHNVEVRKKGGFWRGLFWFLIGGVSAIVALLIIASILVPDAF